MVDVGRRLASATRLVDELKTRRRELMRERARRVRIAARSIDPYPAPPWDDDVNPLIDTLEERVE
jgi:hypothetical protein